MSAPTIEPIPVFDGHNDFLLRLLKAPGVRERTWLQGDGTGHIDMPRMRAGGMAGGFFAIWIPSQAVQGVDHDKAMDKPPYDLPLDPAVPAPGALATAVAMAGHLMWMERASGGWFRICRTATEIRKAIGDGVIAAVMHMEGAEAIGADLDSLHVFHAIGLRSLGPVWSRPNAFGNGVPFRFPSSPDTGPGLTAAGKALVRRCNELRIMLDLSHLNEKGFDDVAELSDAPLVATHSNAHAVCASARNLTDRQLGVIRDTRGMVGLNFATSFLRPDGRRAPDVGFDVIRRHLDHMIEHAGEDHVGFGSDFDGALVPDVIGDATGLPRLQEALIAHGYGEALMRKLCHENWIRLLERTWGA